MSFMEISYQKINDMGLIKVFFSCRKFFVNIYSKYNQTKVFSNAILKYTSAHLYFLLVKFTWKTAKYVLKIYCFIKKRIGI